MIGRRITIRASAGLYSLDRTTVPTVLASTCNYARRTPSAVRCPDRRAPSISAAHSPAVLPGEVHAPHRTLQGRRVSRLRSAPAKIGPSRPASLPGEYAIRAHARRGSSAQTVLK
jgi:hypothetical protein